MVRGFLIRYNNLHNYLDRIPGHVNIFVYYVYILCTYTDIYIILILIIFDPLNDRRTRYIRRFTNILSENFDASILYN